MSTLLYQVSRYKNSIKANAVLKVSHSRDKTLNCAKFKGAFWQKLIIITKKNGSSLIKLEIMNKIVKFLAVIVLFSLNEIIAEETCQYKTASIYSIRNGVIIYPLKQFWIGYETRSDYISNVRNWKPDRANWYLEFEGEYVSFRNREYYYVCLTYLGREYQLATRACEDPSKQLFELIPTSLGTSLIKVKDLNQCVYIYGGLINYYPYTGDCPVGPVVQDKWLWSIIPLYSAQSSKL